MSNPTAFCQVCGTQNTFGPLATPPVNFSWFIFVCTFDILRTQYYQIPSEIHILFWPLYVTIRMVPHHISSSIVSFCKPKRKICNDQNYKMKTLFCNFFFIDRRIVL